MSNRLIRCRLQEMDDDDYCTQDTLYDTELATGKQDFLSRIDVNKYTYATYPRCLYWNEMAKNSIPYLPKLHF